MKKLLMIIVGIVCLTILSTWGGMIYLSHRWEHLWVQVPKQVGYDICSWCQDTLRVALIGDSWAGLHHELGMDSVLAESLQPLVAEPVMVESSGRGGAKTGEIYLLMFDEGAYGTKSLLSIHPDYCVVFAGINDAAANIGKDLYIAHYSQIMDFLLDCDIRPVVVEIPDVLIRELYEDKPLMDYIADYLRAMLRHSNLYDYREYREALLQMLSDRYEGCFVLVPLESWNETGKAVNQRFFDSDGIHLNRRGYQKLDEAIAASIADDYNSRKMPERSISQ